MRVLIRIIFNILSIKYKSDTLEKLKKFNFYNSILKNLCAKFLDFNLK